jgi:hypothetical protein
LEAVPKCQGKIDSSDSSAVCGLTAGTTAAAGHATWRGVCALNCLTRTGVT